MLTHDGFSTMVVPPHAVLPVTALPTVAIWITAIESHNTSLVNTDWVLYSLYSCILQWAMCLYISIEWKGMHNYTGI